MNDHQLMLRKNKALLIGVVFAAAAIAYFTLQEVRAKKHQEELAHLIQINVAAAGAKNQQAVGLCDAWINTILAQQFQEVARKGHKAAEDVASYGSCCTIIYLLARDKVTGSSRTGPFVDGRLHASMDEPLRTLSGDIEVAIGQFEQSLKESTVCLAHDLAQINPTNTARTISLPVDSKTDVSQALKNLGFNGITIGVSIPLDVWFILRGKIVESLVPKVAAITARLFGKTVAKAVVSVGLSEIPVADVISVIGGIWTAYDVYSTQQQFEREMKASLDNMMPQMRRDIQKQVMDRVHSLLKEHERVQDEIRQRSVQEFAR
ncbi:MAG: hypothetical protein ACLQM8_24985 [Limisphaerales bacterium]